jgi:hypothetical protein
MGDHGEQIERRGVAHESTGAQSLARLDVPARRLRENEHLAFKKTVIANLYRRVGCEHISKEVGAAADIACAIR